MATLRIAWVWEYMKAGTFPDFLENHEKSEIRHGNRVTAPVLYLAFPAVSR